MVSRVIGWNQRFVERVPKSLWASTKSLQESPSQEVKRKMALHSEIQAEESHQEQGESAESLGSHDTSTLETHRDKGMSVFA